MAKRTIPAINVPIMLDNKSMELAWYLFLKQLSEGGFGGSKGIDGGFANSVYLSAQKIDGGNA